MTATVTRWFTANRSLAVALVSAGLAMGTLLIAPLSRWLITHYDWREAMLALGCLAWMVIVPAALLLRQPPRRAANRSRPVPAVTTSPWRRCCARRSSPPSR